MREADGEGRQPLPHGVHLVAMGGRGHASPPIVVRCPARHAATTPLPVQHLSSRYGAMQTRVACFEGDVRAKARRQRRLCTAYGRRGTARKCARCRPPSIRGTRYAEQLAHQQAVVPSGATSVSVRASPRRSASTNDECRAAERCCARAAPRRRQVSVGQRAVAVDGVRSATEGRGELRNAGRGRCGVARLLKARACAAGL